MSPMAILIPMVDMVPSSSVVSSLAGGFGQALTVQAARPCRATSPKRPSEPPHLQVLHPSTLVYVSPKQYMPSLPSQGAM